MFILIFRVYLQIYLFYFRCWIKKTIKANPDEKNLKSKVMIAACKIISWMEELKNLDGSEEGVEDYFHV